MSPRLIAGYCGSFNPGKGVELIYQIAQICPSIDFYLVGGTFNDLQRLLPTSIQLPNLFFFGYHPYSQVKNILNTFDVCLLPNSKTVRGYGGNQNSVDIGKWTSPLKLFEYMSLSKIIISSDSPALLEVCVDGFNSYVCPSDDPFTWAHTLKSISMDILSFSHVAEIARMQFLQNYTWSKRASRLLSR